MSLTHFIIIFIAGIAAGTINTVVGSGSLITFPTLVALGYPPLLANVSNNIGLVPGSVSGVYRLPARARRPAGSVCVASCRPRCSVASPARPCCCVLPSKVFQKVVVVLIAIALVLVIVQPILSKRLAARAREGGHGSRDVTFVLAALVFAAGIYGGYFGAAQGIILIAVLGIFLDDDLQRLNASKNVLAMSVNAVASVVFIFSTEVDWKVVGTIAVGSTIGGQIGATRRSSAEPQGAPRRHRGGGPHRPRPPPLTPPFTRNLSSS